MGRARRFGVVVVVLAGVLAGAWFVALPVAERYGGFTLVSWRPPPEVVDVGGRTYGGRETRCGEGARGDGAVQIGTWNVLLGRDRRLYGYREAGVARAVAIETGDGCLAHYSLEDGS